MTVFVSAGPASADRATTGPGQYRDSIDWVTWGTANTTIGTGTTGVSTRTLPSGSLTTSCRLSSISGGIKAYAPGTWSGDYLDDLYSGTTDPQKPLVNAIATTGYMAKTTFTVTCTASLNGTSVPLNGMVFADAEASNYAVDSKNPPKDTAGADEYTKVTATTGSKFRILEMARNDGCPTGTKATLAGTALTLAPTGQECQTATPKSRGGLTQLVYAESQTPANSFIMTVEMRGGGTSAIAMGFVYNTDFGDAPASYEVNKNAGGAVYQPTWTGGEITGNIADIFAGGPGVATQGSPALRLGSSIDSEDAPWSSSDGRGDDTHGVDDEDAVGNLGSIGVTPGQTYTLPNVRCSGSGWVSGWVDWNGNGVFDTGEKSNTPQCTGSSVDLTWTVPADLKPTTADSPSFMRLRIATSSATAGSPLGVTAGGEVEDHPLQITVPTLTVQKNVSQRVKTSDQFVLSAVDSSGKSLGSATTTGSSTGLQNVSMGPVQVTGGSTVTISEAMAGGSGSALSDYQSGYKCTAAYSDGTTSDVTSKANASSGTVSIPAIPAGKSAPAVTCVFTNDPQTASLTVSKSWIIKTPTDQTGQTYANGSQPAGISADLTLTPQGGQGAAQTWGTEKTGFTSGQQIGLSEKTTIAASMPGCSLTSQKITSVNGATTDQALTSNLTLITGKNTATVTNTVNCTTSLTLNKTVANGGADPKAWTLHATDPSGNQPAQGPTGTKSTIPAATTLQLWEDGGPAVYTQDDSRTAAEKQANPLASGSWNCIAVDASGATVTGVITGRMGLDGTLKAPLGSSITCTAVNRTANLTVLKSVENPKGTPAAPSAWNLTATPDAGVNGLTPTTVKGSSTVSGANTFQVRPGQGYKFSEADGPGGYLFADLQLFTGSDPTDAAQLANSANWKSVPKKDAVSVDAGKTSVYRLVNRAAAMPMLPFAGGSGLNLYFVGGALALLAALAAVFVTRRRAAASRDQARHRAA